jgi:hypothetical protein
MTSMDLLRQSICMELYYLTNHIMCSIILKAHIDPAEALQWSLSLTAVLNKFPQQGFSLTAEEAYILNRKLDIIFNTYPVFRPTL